MGVPGTLMNIQMLGKDSIHCHCVLQVGQPFKVRVLVVQGFNA